MVPHFYHYSYATLAVAFVLLLLGALEVSYRIGIWRTRGKPGEERQPNGGDVVPTAMLGLLGLLLAFTYAFTVSRSDGRKSAVLDEINAVETAFLQADLLDEPVRTEIRERIVEFTRTLTVEREDTLGEKFPETLNRMDKAVSRLWPAARKLGNHADLTPYEVRFVGSMNELLDAHTARRAKAFDHLPGAILVMLLFVGCASMAVAGYGSGRHGHLQRWRMTALALSIAAVMTTVTDFDRPLVGFVRVDQGGYIDLIEFMEKELGELSPEGPGPR